MSKEDLICKEHFVYTHRRDTLGRYIVSLPLKGISSKINNSYHLDVNRFLRIKKTLTKQPELFSMYKEFMLEYENQGHTKTVKPNGLATSYIFTASSCVLLG